MVSSQFLLLPLYQERHKNIHQLYVLSYLYFIYILFICWKIHIRNYWLNIPINTINSYKQNTIFTIISPLFLFLKVILKNGPIFLGFIFKIYRKIGFIPVRISHIREFSLDIFPHAENLSLSLCRIYMHLKMHFKEKIMI